MTLPASGTISMSQINTELGYAASEVDSSLQARTTQTNPNINQTAPYSMSEFYSHTQTSVVVSPTSTNPSSAAGNFNLTITTTEAWTLSDGGAAWVTPAATSGSGNDVVNIAYDENLSGSTRFATITVSITGDNATCVIAQNPA